MVDGPNYRVELVQSGGCERAKPCSVNAIILAKGEYHINENYPYKFTAQNPPVKGLSYPKPVVGRDEGEFDQHKAVLKVPFTVDASGDKLVGGVVSLSVCSAANCLMDKQALELAVRVN